MSRPSNVCDELENPQLVESSTQCSGQGRPLPHNEGTLTIMRPCPVCFDLNLPHWSSKEECQAYRDLAIDQTGVDPDYTWGRLVIPLRMLQATAEAGCPTCGLLKDIWGRLPPDKYAGVCDKECPDVEHGEFRIHARKDRASQSKVFTIEFEENEYAYKPRFCFYRGPGDDTTSSLAKILSPLPWLATRPTPSDVKRFVEPRIARCLSDHSRCSTTTGDINSDYLPTRLIAVLNDEGFAVDPFLVETASISRTACHDTRYISLSHCWGSSRPMTTTRDNYKDHLSSIPWDFLPRTFQDAILVARALGVRFIWIDSLCITQDDGEDWAREASMMAGIYENAWLTIAATAAVDGRQGLFTDRIGDEKAQIAHCGSPVLLRPVVDHSEFIAYTEKPSRSLPLLWRGWGLQEQILSTRVLHFTPEELLWECRSEMSCECSPEASGDSLREIGQSLGAARSVWGRHPVETGANMRDWYKLVEVYMKRDLTYDSDRLPALSGIANAFQRTLVGPGRYLAGLWESDLIRGLLWRVDRPRPRDPSYKTALSSPPSWSWASVGQCSIYWPVGTPKGIHVAEVIDASCTRSTVDDKGMVSGGELTLRGKLIPLKIQYVVGKELEAAEPWWHSNTTDPVDDRFWRSCRLAQDECFMPDVQLSPPGENLPPGSVLYFLPLIKVPHWAPSMYTRGLLAQGIFLRQLPECSSPSEDEERGPGHISSPLFARVGCGALDFLAPTRGTLDPFARLGEYGDTIVTIV